MNEKELIKKYRTISIIGIIIMGIGSFMSCLSTSTFGMRAGTLLLCISIILSIIGFSKWQP
ncbi:hypothetical protein ABID14_000808 [Peptoniphilus olsenii]|uniref:Uncharacterized protein n=1 Tax=Peptoniphilus olsenii TaxID=411570 RepID=A0ABV2JBB8_9FIRM